MSNNMITYHEEITPLTMAILRESDANGPANTLIMEEGNEYRVFTNPTKIIDLACRFYGSSLRGRLDGTRDVSGLTHKAPIAIDPNSGMYFFPTASPLRNYCSWLSHSHIEQIRQRDQGARAEVVFLNGKSVKLDVSYGSLQNQLYRTAQFRFALTNRMKKIHSVLDTKKKRNEEEEEEKE